MLPLLAIVAWSGTGKTTLLKQLIPLLKARHIRPGLIKHTHHQMDVDTPGKDSYQLRKAGADQVMVASDRRWALMTETSVDKQLDLKFLARQFDSEMIDLILVEGFKGEDIPKIVLWRDGIKGEVNALIDDRTIAIAADVPVRASLTQLDLNHPAAIADFIAAWLNTPPGRA